MNWIERIKQFAVAKPRAPKFTAEFRSRQAGKRIAVVGLGSMGMKHALILAAIGYEMRGVCDTREDRLALAHDAMPAARCHRDFHELDPSELDVVIVATLANSHAPIVQALVERGFKRILLEKPVANTVEDLGRIEHAANGDGVTIHVHHYRRWSPDYRRFKESARAGDLGGLKSVTCHAKSGGFGNIGTHYIDAVLYLFERRILEAVTADFDLSSPGSHREGCQDPNGRCTYVLEGGVSFSLDTLVAGAASDRQVMLRCEFERGVMEIVDSDDAWYHEDRSGQRHRHPFEIRMTTSFLQGQERARFLDAIVSDLLQPQTTPSTVFDGCRAAEAVIAAHVASAEKRNVPLPLGGDTKTVFPFS